MGINFHEFILTEKEFSRGLIFADVSKFSHEY